MTEYTVCLDDLAKLSLDPSLSPETRDIGRGFLCRIPGGRAAYVAAVLAACPDAKARIAKATVRR